NPWPEGTAIYTSVRDQFGNLVVNRPETSWPNEMSIDEVVDVFIRRMNDIGIKSCLAFPGPSIGSVADAMKDSDAEYQFTKAYTQYMVDNFSKYDELVSPILVPSRL